jgi:hypothetical protein
MCHHSDASVLCVRHLRCPFLLSICLWQHDHLLPLAPSKFDYVFVSELKVATRFEILAVQLRAITAFQIDNVGLDLSSLALHTELVFDRLLYVPELDGCMLSTRAGVLKDVVDDFM